MMKGENSDLEWCLVHRWQLTLNRALEMNIIVKDDIDEWIAVAQKIQNVRALKEVFKGLAQRANLKILGLKYKNRTRHSI